MQRDGNINPPAINTDLEVIREATPPVSVHTETKVMATVTKSFVQQTVGVFDIVFEDITDQVVAEESF